MKGDTKGELRKPTPQLDTQMITGSAFWFQKKWWPPKTDRDKESFVDALFYIILDTCAQGTSKGLVVVHMAGMDGQVWA